MQRTLAAFVVTVAVINGCTTGRQTESPSAASPSVASAPTQGLTPAPTLPSRSPNQDPSVSPKTHVVRPFGQDGFDLCPRVDASCVEDPRDDSITFTFDAPASWEQFGESGVWIDGNAPPAGATLFFYRGSWLYGDPCRPKDVDEDPDIRVGPTVDDFVTALVDHPSLDVTSPVDVTLAGYSGKYVDLLVPDDTSACAVYRPMDGHIYAQGPGQRWHMWVLDVGGVRVLVETNDYAGTSAKRLAEEQAMIDSLEIKP
jgi:hypothetical protein